MFVSECQRVSSLRHESSPQKRGEARDSKINETKQLGMLQK